MLREDIVKVLEIVAVFLADIRVDDVEVISYELRAAHQLSLCSVGVHVATRSVCQAMQQRLIELHVSFMARYRLRFIALYRWENRLIWTMTEEQAIAAADVAFEESLEEVQIVAIADSNSAVQGPLGFSFDESGRQVAIDRPGGTVQLEELRALRQELDEHLRMQLYFTVKMKFHLEAILPDADLDDDGNVVEFDSRETYLLSPAPWVVAPDADMERRLTSIVETAREKLDQHLEAAALRGSGDLIGGIRQVYILVSPGAEMARLPPAPAVGNRPVGTFVRLPPELERKKCFWNPQTADHSCFAWCIRAALLGVENLDRIKRRTLARLSDAMLFQEGYAPVSGQHKKHRAEVVPRNFGFDFSTLPAGDRGVTWADIEEFERVNGHRLRIFVWEWHKVEWRQQTVYETVFERVVVREPRLMNHPFEKEIHLLRHENHFF
ncbi:hypothetical protein AK812_SmicGene45169 [Symbiodinium microadriaticum]|uniref:Uncharacterized protein n=1 Tax=Symbiodinium microadriaticum TaxID=2951 RepID=A0A1Q9BWQ4_SYMMI|nr:hypothetical protein AK812_SmicGene45169 [Symbiodinium microadriaticum]